MPPDETSGVVVGGLAGIASGAGLVTPGTACPPRVLANDGAMVGVGVEGGGGPRFGKSVGIAGPGMTLSFGLLVIGPSGPSGPAESFGLLEMGPVGVNGDAPDVPEFPSD